MVVGAAKREARETAGKDVGIFAGGYIVCADSEAEAWRRYEYVVRDRLDVAMTSEFVKLWAKETRSDDVVPMQDRVDRMAAGFNALPLVGTAEQIVERMQQMADGGLAGLAISFDDYDEGIAAYDEALRPLLIEAGCARCSRRRAVPGTCWHRAGTADLRRGSPSGRTRKRATVGGSSDRPGARGERGSCPMQGCSSGAIGLGARAALLPGAGGRRRRLRGSGLPGTRWPDSEKEIGVFMVSIHAFPKERIPLHRSFIEAAVRRGVGHITYLSFLNPSQGATFVHATSHAATEEMLEQSGSPTRLFETACTRTRSRGGSTPRVSPLSVRRGPPHFSYRPELAEAIAVGLTEEAIEGDLQRHRARAGELPGSQRSPPR